MKKNTVDIALKILVFSALTFTAPMMAHAQAVKAEPSERRLELAHKIIESMGGVQNFSQMLDGMTGGLSSTMSRSYAQSDPKLVLAMQDSVKESTHALLPRILDGAAQIYAEDFDEAQLSDLLAFYESPTGRAMTAKMPMVGQQSGQLMVGLVPSMQVDILHRFCDKTDCPPNLQQKVASLTLR